MLMGMPFVLILLCVHKILIEVFLCFLLKYMVAYGNIHIGKYILFLLVHINNLGILKWKWKWQGATQTLRVAKQGQVQ